MNCREIFNFASTYELKKLENSAIAYPIANATIHPIKVKDDEGELVLLKDFHELSNDIFLLLQILDLNIIFNRLEKATKALDLIYERLFLFVKEYGPIKSHDKSQNLTELLLDDEFMRTVLYCSFDRVKDSLEFIDGKQHDSFPVRLNTVLSGKTFPYQSLKDLRCTFLKENKGISSMVPINQYTTFAELYKLMPDIDDEKPRKFSQKQKATDLYMPELEEGLNCDFFAQHLWTYYLEGIKTSADGIIEFNGKLDIDLNISFDVNNGEWDLYCNPKSLLEVIQFYKFFGNEGKPSYISKCKIPECNKMVTNDRRAFCSPGHGVMYQNRVRLLKSKQQALKQDEDVDSNASTEKIETKA